MARNPNRELARKVIDRQMKTGATAQEIVDKIDPLLHDPRMGNLAQELHDAKAEIERLKALLDEVKRARTDADDQYMEADYWRESYRLAKGLSNEEIGAIIAVRDASKAHPRPCGFPHKTCVCED